MRNLTILILATFFIANQGQSQKIDLVDVDGETIKGLVNTYMGGEAPDELYVPFVYLLKNKNQTECFIGLISSRDELRNNIPSYYFMMNDLFPVLVYTGHEKHLKFSEQHQKEIAGLADKFLFKEDFVLTIHDRLFYAKIKFGKVVKWRENATKKQVKSFDRLWMTSPSTGLCTKCWFY